MIDSPSDELHRSVVGAKPELSGQVGVTCDDASFCDMPFAYPRYRCGAGD